MFINLSSEMKILYIITQADGGGAQTYVLSLAKYFQGAIAAGTENDRLFKDALRAELVAYPLSHLKRNINIWNEFSAVWEIRELIKTLRPDIIHLNSSKAGILGSFANIGLGTKVVFTAHGFIFNEPRPWPIKAFFLALEKIASCYRDHIICVSEADRKAALDFSVIDGNKMSVIYNGITLINFYPASEAKLKLNLNPKKLIIGAVANFYKTKGLDILIQAVSLLPANIQEQCQFIIMGAGPEKDALQTLNHQLNTNIFFAGDINEAAQFILAFDIFVLPSRKEGFPYAILEALQAGLPIVATDVGGVKEALGDAGVLVPPEDPAKLSQEITALVNNAELRKTLSQKSLIQSQNFTLEKMLKETNNIYQKLLNH